MNNNHYRRGRNGQKKRRVINVSVQIKMQWPPKSEKEMEFPEAKSLLAAGS
jgi:hypothetical protein